MTSVSETMPQSDDLVPLADDDDPGQPQERFRHVLRGYDPRQVDELIDRYEAVLDDRDDRHEEDQRRVAALEQQVAELSERLDDAERRASGRPEPASRVGERLARLLALAEEEAEAIRTGARQEAEALLSAAREQAAVDTAERTKDLEKREREVERAQREAEQARLEAQKDAEQVRTRAAREAERELEQARARADALRVSAERDAEKALETAREDVRLLHEQTQRDAAQARAQSAREVQELGRQKESLLAQLAQLRDAIAAAVGPLAGTLGDDPAATQRMRLPRTDPGA